MFWVQLVVLLAVARTLGSLARRAGQPRVVGELSAGIVLGPSILGRVAPGVADWIFPGTEVASSLLLAVAWLGIFLLLVVTGFETDLGLLRRLGRPAANVSVGSLLLPLALGVTLGLLLPATFQGDRGGRLGLALFMGVALSISALPVVAKILSDMRLMRRDVGQITIAAGMANDLVGWLLLGVVSGLVAADGIDAAGLLVTIALLAAFLGAAFTVGQRAADALLRRMRGAHDAFTGAMTATVLVALAAGALTHAMGVEAVLGALVAGIVLGRSRFQHADVPKTLEALSHAVFAPIFFGTAGLYVDFGVVFEDGAWVWAIVVVLVASIGKLVGSYLPARWSGLSSQQGLAIGLGLNARGALEIVVATVGFSLGVLTDVSYAVIVLMALATSIAAPVLLRPVLRRMTADPVEAARLEREETLQGSVIASASHVLMPTRGGSNSIAAARLLAMTLQPEASVTVLSVSSPTEDDLVRPDLVDAVLGSLGKRQVDRRRHLHPDPAADVLREATLGYDLMVLGLTENFAGTHTLSEPLRRIIAGSNIPILLVRRSRRPGDDPSGIQRVFVPLNGTRVGRAAEEIAYVLGSNLQAHVDAVHVRPEDQVSRADAVNGQLDQARLLARQYGGAVRVASRAGAHQHEEILRAAEMHDSDLIVVGAQRRTVADGGFFLGYGPEHVLEAASMMVAVVVFPTDG